MVPCGLICLGKFKSRTLPSRYGKLRPASSLTVHKVVFRALPHIGSSPLNIERLRIFLTQGNDLLFS